MITAWDWIFSVSILVGGMVAAFIGVKLLLEMKSMDSELLGLVLIWAASIMFPLGLLAVGGLTWAAVML